MIESISAVTLATHDMPRAVRFYRMLGFEVIHGGDDAEFTSFRAGRGYPIWSPSLPRGSGRGGGASSSIIPPSMPCTRTWLRPATGRTRHRAMPNGAGVSST